MKADKKNKKTLIIVLLVLLVIVIALSGLVGLMEKANTEEAQRQRGYGRETQPALTPTEYVPEKTIKNSNISVLSRLKGDLPTSNVVSKVKTAFVDELPKVMEEVEGYDKTKLREYYKEHKSTIKSKLRIGDEDNFVKMIEQVSKLTSKLDTDYKACDYFSNEDGLGFTFSYENGESITCKIVGDNSNTITFEF